MLESSMEKFASRTKDMEQLGLHQLPPQSNQNYPLRKLLKMFSEVACFIYYWCCNGVEINPLKHTTSNILEFWNFQCSSSSHFGALASVESPSNQLGLGEGCLFCMYPLFLWVISLIAVNQTLHHLLTGRWVPTHLLCE